MAQGVWLLLVWTPSVMPRAKVGQSVHPCQQGLLLSSRNAGWKPALHPTPVP